jgi:beta-N-acetylhexosaminidase
MRRFVPALGLLLAACTTSGQGATAPASPSPTAVQPATSSAPASHSAHRSTPAPPRSSTPHPVDTASAQQVFALMNERQRVGQLLMVDCPTGGPTSATTTAITQYHVGAVILDGTSYSGVQSIGAVTALLQRTARGRAGLLVATDQEGGLVQRLRGPGFSTIPDALTQGSYPTSVLRDDARQWGRELRRAGVNVNLAPVLDTVPAGFGSNPPIGDLDREYGHTPSRPAMQGVAFAEGMDDVGVAATVKHFPGLGRVRGNTDTTGGVTDTVTTRDDPYLLPFRVAISAAHVPFVMMSTAIYSRIDPGVPAAFSPTIVTGMLRGDLGFRGLIISDDLGGARQVSGYPVGQRAVKFVAAGGDVVLTVDAGQAAAMTQALLARAAKDPAFKAKVDAAALLVLQEKQRLGLLA